MVKLHTIVLVSIEDFNLPPCGTYRNFKDGREYDLLEILYRVQGMTYFFARDLAWAINNSPKLQKPGALEKVLQEFLDTEPTANVIGTLIRLCDFAKVRKMFKAFWKADPDMYQIAQLLNEKHLKETPKNMRRLKAAKEKHANEILLLNPDSEKG